MVKTPTFAISNAAASAAVSVSNSVPAAVAAKGVVSASVPTASVPAHLYSPVGVQRHKYLTEVLFLIRKSCAPKLRLVNLTPNSP